MATGKTPKTKPTPGGVGEAAARKRIRFKTASQLADHLRNPFQSTENVLDLIEDVQDMAEEQLEVASKRVGVRTGGLADGELMVALEAVVTRVDARPKDAPALALLKVCIRAKTPSSTGHYDWGAYTRDSLILAFAKFIDADAVSFGKKHSAAQRERRKGKPGRDDGAKTDRARNERIRRQYQASKGERGTIKRLAIDFGLSEKQISRIVSDLRT